MALKVGLFDWLAERSRWLPTRQLAPRASHINKVWEIDAGLAAIATLFLNIFTTLNFFRAAEQRGWPEATDTKDWQS